MTGIEAKCPAEVRRVDCCRRGGRNLDRFGGLNREWLRRRPAGAAWPGGESAQRPEVGLRAESRSRPRGWGGRDGRRQLDRLGELQRPGWWRPIDQRRSGPGIRSRSGNLRFGRRLLRRRHDSMERG
jgi:hypothetical protein